jgi:hypothetical protein
MSLPGAGTARERVALVISHPIQYHAPLYAHLARDGRFELRVFYMTDRGARPYYEPLARSVISHGNAVLQGYDHVFMKRGEPRSLWAGGIDDLTRARIEQSFAREAAARPGLAACTEP